MREPQANVFSPLREETAQWLSKAFAVTASVTSPLPCHVPLTGHENRKLSGSVSPTLELVWGQLKTLLSRARSPTVKS